ncbi:unnamed protein product [Nesidiocoris tenuis]|uniref:WD repeat-containing protein 92 n=1 Tax=Nesidiocoris tenuis TaxID=355587 RepID=A0A6H5GYH8_9HEMI|nr:unnamed protein product [Nesidiocoris tenuis]
MYFRSDSLRDSFSLQEMSVNMIRQKKASHNSQTMRESQVSAPTTLTTSAPDFPPNSPNLSNFSHPAFLDWAVWFRGLPVFIESSVNFDENFYFLWLRNWATDSAKYLLNKWPTSTSTIHPTRIYRSRMVPEAHDVPESADDRNSMFDEDPLVSSSEHYVALGRIGNDKIHTFRRVIGTPGPGEWPPEVSLPLTSFKVRAPTPLEHVIPDLCREGRDLLSPADAVGRYVDATDLDRQSAGTSEPSEQHRTMVDQQVSFPWEISESDNSAGQFHFAVEKTFRNVFRGLEFRKWAYAPDGVTTADDAYAVNAYLDAEGVLFQRRRQFVKPVLAFSVDLRRLATTTTCLKSERIHLPGSLSRSPAENENHWGPCSALEVPEEVHKPPSYVALACCISGYTSLVYDSKQRQGLHSRTASPIRVDGTSSKLIAPTNITQQLSPSSFIVQRVERLYGPGALAQGFYTLKKNNTTPTNTTKIAPKRNPWFKQSIIGPNLSSRRRSTISDNIPTFQLSRRGETNGNAQRERRYRCNGSETGGPRKRGSQRRPLFPEGEYLFGFIRLVPVSRSSSKVGPVQFPRSAGASQQGPNLAIFYLFKCQKRLFQLHSDQVTALEELATIGEKELSSCDNDEACGVLRAASGKARLLVAQKLNQFKGLCLKNIVSLANRLNRHYVATSDNTCYLSAGEEKTDDPAKGSAKPAGATTKKAIAKKIEPKAKEANRARDEARRKMIEERRRAMKESRDANANDFIVPNSSFSGARPKLKGSFTCTNSRRTIQYCSRKDLERMKEPVYEVDAHGTIINAIDGFGGQVLGCGPPEIVTGSRDGLVKLWDPRQKEDPVAVMEPVDVREKRDCWAVAFGNAYNNQDRVICAGYDNGDVKMFDLKKMAVRWEKNLKNGICSVQFDRREIEMNKLVVTTLESKFFVFELRTQHPKKGFASLKEKAHDSTIWQVSHLPQNRDIFMTCGGNGTVCLWKYVYPSERCRKDVNGDKVGVIGKLDLLQNSILTTQPVHSFDWCPDKTGLALATSFDQTFRTIIVTKLSNNL